MSKKFNKRIYKAEPDFIGYKVGGFRVPELCEGIGFSDNSIPSLEVGEAEVKPPILYPIKIPPKK